MHLSLKVLIPSLAASVLLAACGSSSHNATGSSTAPSRSAASQTGSGGSSELVKTASSSTLGSTILVTKQGMTLYRLSGEQGGKFICTSAKCIHVWHPLAAASGSAPGGGIASLGTVKRPDGSEQVTYKNMPLYTFALDHAAGDTHGQGIKDVGTWSAVTTRGSPTNAGPSQAAPAPATAPAPAPAPAPGGGYGY